MDRLFYLVVWFHVLGLSLGAVLVTRPGSSERECAKLCRDEAEIDCRYYKFNRAKSVCTLTTRRDQTIRKLRKLGDVAKKKTAISWVSQLQARVTALEQKDLDSKNMRRQMAELRAEIEALKAGRALTHHLIRTNKEQVDQNLAALDNKADSAAGEIKRVESTVVTLTDMQKAVAGKLRQLSEDIRSDSLTISMLSQANKDARGNLREMVSTVTEIKATITDIKKSITDLQVRFAGLSTDVMEKVANVDAIVGPELKDLKYAQTTVAQSLSVLTKKIMVISPRIPEIEKSLATKDSRLTTAAMQMEGLDKQLRLLKERMSFTENEIKKIFDPSSKMNADRRNALMSLQSQMESMLTTQNRMQNDLTAEVADRGKIYKELTQTKLTYKAIADQLINIDDQMRRTKRALKTLIGIQPKDEVLANVIRRQLSTLASLKSLQKSQKSLGQAVAQYSIRLSTSQRELARRMEMRKGTENKLKVTLTHLIAMYQSLSRAMTSEKKKKKVRMLIKLYNTAVQKINSLQAKQEETFDAMDYLNETAFRTDSRLEQQINEKLRSDAKLRTLQKKILLLQKTVATKRMVLRVITSLPIGKQIDSLTQKQRDIILMLSQYRSELNQTKVELSFQKKTQQKTVWMSNSLHKQLDKLHKTLAPVIKIQDRQVLLNEIRKVVEEELRQMVRDHQLKFFSGFDGPLAPLAPLPPEKD